MGFSITWDNVYERAVYIHASWEEMNNSREVNGCYSFRFNDGQVLRINRISYGRNPVTTMNLLSAWIVEQHKICVLVP